jgi:cytochrome c oxidase assembly protein subunit 15
MSSLAPQIAAAPAPLRRARPNAIATWLLAVAALVFLMVVVGGITRLTESGLSIVRWDVVSGTLPPLGTEQWQAAFDAYRTSPQYLEVNRGMSLDQFKEIFFWEYVHRLLGRLIGLAFALPLAWFALRRAIPRGCGWRLVALLALGGLQGTIGWWMVASGLIDRPEVSHIRLAIHLMTALLILGGLVWTALDLRLLARDPAARPARVPTAAVWALSVLGLQIMFGAYVAGLEAGYAFSTWPMMGDEWFPAATPMFEPFLRNLVDNPIVVQFVHRWLAFVVAITVYMLGFSAWDRGLRAPAAAAIGTVSLQILLGIATLLSGVDLHIAVAHQATAALLVASVVWTAHRLGERRAWPKAV